MVKKPGSRPSPSLARLRERAALPPARPRAVLTLGPDHVAIGSIEPELALRLVQAGLPLRDAGVAWQVHGPANASLAAIARWLDQQGLGGRWRGELLDVTDANRRPLAAIERAAVRPLGIATFAVHLVCVRADGSVWVQQRALDKATDPGQWDTTMGGQVGAGETPADTLVRETWEEAGLHPAQLQELRHVEVIAVRRPVHEGYLVEQIDVYEAAVADTVQPQNQDGEVHCFECLSPDEVAARLSAEAFTLEAALILCAWLERRPTRVR